MRRTWTLDEEKELLRLCDGTKTVEQISQLMNIKPSPIKAKIIRMTEKGHSMTTLSKVVHNRIKRLEEEETFCEKRTFDTKEEAVFYAKKIGGVFCKVNIACGEDTYSAIWRWYAYKPVDHKPKRKYVNYPVSSAGKISSKNT